MASAKAFGEDRLKAELRTSPSTVDRFVHALCILRDLGLEFRVYAVLGVAHLLASDTRDNETRRPPKGGTPNEPFYGR